MKKFLSVALLSTALVQQAFAQGYGPQNGQYRGQQFPDSSYRDQANNNAAPRGNIVNDPDNVEPFGTPDERFEQRNAEFRRFAEKQCPSAMHFTQPNHPTQGPGSERQ